jgi:hypothetical protein
MAEMVDLAGWLSAMAGRRKQIVEAKHIGAADDATASR